jgi:hypothetical protein
MERLTEKRLIQAIAGFLFQCAGSRDGEKRKRIRKKKRKESSRGANFCIPIHYKRSLFKCTKVYIGTQEVKMRKKNLPT